MVEKIYLGSLYRRLSQPGEPGETTRAVTPPNPAFPVLSELRFGEDHNGAYVALVWVAE